MSEHSTSSPRRVNRFLAACLSLSLVTGTAVITSTSAPVAFAQDAENDDTNPGNNSKDKDEQPEVSSWDTSSVATDDESDLGRAVNAISLVLAVGGMVGIAASLVMHFAAMALPEVPW